MANQTFSTKFPIRIPSHPKQYRAIGVVRGIYKPSVSALTKGELITLAGEKINTVLLGKTISVVKNHVDLTKNHDWIVYPHSTFQIYQPIHLQITGIWQPKSEQDENQQSNFTEDYFSIRGEVIYSSQQEQKVIVKIYHNNSTKRNRCDFFKLQLRGIIPNYTVKHFYDFDVILDKQQLNIRNYIDLGLIAVKYRRFSTSRYQNHSERKRYVN